MAGGHRAPVFRQIATKNTHTKVSKTYGLALCDKESIKDKVW